MFPPLWEDVGSYDWWMDHYTWGGGCRALDLMKYDRTLIKQKKKIFQLRGWIIMWLKNIFLFLKIKKLLFKIYNTI